MNEERIAGLTFSEVRPVSINGSFENAYPLIGHAGKLSEPELDKNSHHTKDDGTGSGTLMASVFCQQR